MTAESRCVLSWILSCVPSTKSLPQYLHMYGYNCKCLRMCVLSWFVCLKRTLHTSHEWGFSPVCISKCRLRAWGCVNPRLHSWHLWGRSPECMTECVSIWDFTSVEYGQKLHLKRLRGSSLRWVFLWLFRASKDVKILQHLLHSNPKKGRCRG